MINYTVTNPKNPYYKALVTVFDYEPSLSAILSPLKLGSMTGRVIVDALLFSGMNQYRFIDVGLKNGKLDLNDYRYVAVYDELEHTANAIIRMHPASLYNSVLTKEQANEIGGL